MSQTDRKYDGPPHSEQKRYPPKTPMPPSFSVRQLSPVTSDVINISLWQLTSYGWGEQTDDPFTGCSYRAYERRFAAGHVVKRLHALLRKDRGLGIFWLEEQGTKRQLSPEFSNVECLVNWLVYEGFQRGWLTVATAVYDHWSYAKPRRVVRYKEH